MNALLKILALMALGGTIALAAVCAFHFLLDEMDKGDER